MKIRDLWVGVAAGVVLAVAGGFAVHGTVDSAEAQRAVSVTPAQLQINQRISQAAVRRANAANRQLTGLAPEVAKNTGAIQALSSAPNVGPSGAAGPPGPAGPQGPAGAIDLGRISYVQNGSTVAPGPTDGSPAPVAIVEALCAPGQRVVGGGFGSSGSVKVIAAVPVSGDRFSVSGVNESPSVANLVATAVCVAP